MCADKSGISLCAEQNGKILGLACAYMREISGDAVQLPRTKAFVDDFAVLPQARGQGIGTALMDARRGAGGGNFGYRVSWRRFAQRLRCHPENSYVLRHYVPDALACGITATCGSNTRRA